MKKILCVAVCAMLFALWSVAEAQQSKKVPRIGFLTNISSSTSSPRTEAFRQGLRELGYAVTVHGLERNILSRLTNDNADVARYSAGRSGRGILPSLAIYRSDL